MWFYLTPGGITRSTDRQRANNSLITRKDPTSKFGWEGGINLLLVQKSFSSHFMKQLNTTNTPLDHVDGFLQMVKVNMFWLWISCWSENRQLDETPYLRIFCTSVIWCWRGNVQVCQIYSERATCRRQDGQTLGRNEKKNRRWSVRKHERHVWNVTNVNLAL